MQNCRYKRSKLQGLLPQQRALMSPASIVRGRFFQVAERRLVTSDDWWSAHKVSRTRSKWSRWLGWQSRSCRGYRSPERRKQTPLNFFSIHHICKNPTFSRIGLPRVTSYGWSTPQPALRRASIRSLCHSQSSSMVRGPSKTANPLSRPCHLPIEQWYSSLSRALRLSTQAWQNRKRFTYRARTRFFWTRAKEAVTRAG